MASHQSRVSEFRFLIHRISESSGPGPALAGWASSAAAPPPIDCVAVREKGRHSLTKHLTRPVFASVLPTQRDRLPDPRSAGFTPSVIRSGLRPLSAGSSQRAAESCSSSYGLHVRLRLLSTPHHDDAVTFGYRERASPGGGLSPPRSRLLPGARMPAYAGMTNGDIIPEGAGRNGLPKRPGGDFNFSSDVIGPGNIISSSGFPYRRNV